MQFEKEKKVKVGEIIIIQNYLILDTPIQVMF